MIKKLFCILALFAGLGTLASAQLPPEIPTLLDMNLLNLDGSNIDTSLLLTIDYFDSDLTLQSMNSVDDAGDGTRNTILWSEYLGKSNLYSDVAAKDGTDITITVDGYEPTTVTAVLAGYVTGDYYLVPVDNSPGNGCENKNENGNRKNC